MRYFLITLTLLVGSFSFSNAQEISIKKTFGGYKFVQYGKTLKMRELGEIVKSNETSFELIKKGHTGNFIGQVLGSVGGFIIGWQLGNLISNIATDLNLAGIGAGLIVIGIPISIKSNKNTNLGLEIYNNTLEPTSQFEFQRSLKFDGIYKIKTSLKF